MLKPRFELIVTSLIVLTLGVAIGCGDGTVHKERIPKLPASGSRGGAGGGVNGLGAKLNGGTTGGAGAGAGASATAKDQIDAYKKQVEAYPPQNDLTSFPEGTYTLDTVTTIYNYTPNSGWVALLNPSQVVINGTSVTTSTNGTPISTGILADHVDNGRAMIVPVSVAVVKDQNLLFDAKSATLTRKFVAQVAQSKTTLQAADNFSTDASVNKDTLNLNDLVNAGGNALDGNNNKVGVSVRTIDTTHVQVEINADDLLITQTTATKSNAKEGSVTRTFVFIYKFTAPPQALAEPGHITTPKNSPAAASAPNPDPAGTSPGPTAPPAP